MSRRTKVLIAAGAAIALGTGALMLRSATAPDGLEDLERAQTAGERAQDTSAEIAANLREISRNLSEGFDLTKQSAEIHDLTERQRDSLEDLADLLEEQLAALDRSVGLVERAGETGESLAQLSQRQKRLIEQTVASLQRLRELARTAGAASANFARNALYGARLAEDSRDAFSEPGPSR